MKMRIAPLWLALAGVCLAWIPPAGAQMANDLTIGNPKAMALGNAVTADETGIDSVHYKPGGADQDEGPPGDREAAHRGDGHPRRLQGAAELRRRHLRPARRPGRQQPQPDP